MVRLLAFLLGVALLLGALVPASAQTTQPRPASVLVPGSGTGGLGGPSADTGRMMSSMVSGGADTVRDRVVALALAAPRVPGDIERAADAFGAMREKVSYPWLGIAAVLFVAGGLFMRQLAFWSTRTMLQRLFDAPADTVSQRVRVLGMRLGFGIYWLGAYLFGSLGAFLLLPWPPVFREMVLTLLGAAMLNRLAVALGRIVLAPGARHLWFRVLPFSTPLARFWYAWLVSLATLAAAAWASLDLLRILGVTPITLDVVSAGWTGLLGLAALVMLWRRFHLRGEPAVNRVVVLVLSAAIPVAWGLWVTQLDGPFVTLALAAGLPLGLALVHLAVLNVTRLGTERTPAAGWTVVSERALRAVLILGAALLLARAWHVNLGDIAREDTPLTLAIRGGLRITIVVLVADVAWRLVRAFVEGQLAPGALLLEQEGHTPEQEEAVRHHQRLATLLPILRNILFVLIGGVAILMGLDAVGVQIGPLLAGAGVVGIAVGFGAQTLVKDIISGIFYLLDDAFRIGEYVQTSSHKGTVESFSLRSVKLRHHRGPLTTVPFGELGAVQNMSRDWVIDKITLGVTYDTDLDKVKKVVKEIGKRLLEDEDTAPQIIETLKMQGVEQMADYAIQIRLKVMTRPGEQFIVRRRAYAMIKTAFEQNGIRFATPTVTVGREEAEDHRAAAGAVQTLLKPAPPGEPQAA